MADGCDACNLGQGAYRYALRFSVNEVCARRSVSGQGHLQMTMRNLRQYRHSSDCLTCKACEQRMKESAASAIHTSLRGQQLCRLFAFLPQCRSDADLLDTTRIACQQGTSANLMACNRYIIYHSYSPRLSLSCAILQSTFEPCL